MAAQPADFTSGERTTPAVRGTNTAGGAGIAAVSDGGNAVEGHTKSGQAIVGTAEEGTAIIGTSPGFGVVGVSPTGKAIEGRTDTGQAVVGTAGSGGTAIIGVSEGGFGVVGVSPTGKAIEGRTDTGQAVVGTAGSGGTAIIGVSEGGFGVVGVSPTGKAIEGRTDTGQAVVGTATDPAGRAGFFNGNIEVTGDVLLSGADVAEQFDVAPELNGHVEIAPGTVVVLDSAGALRPCSKEYDPCVAGVVSGAGDRRPALVLDRKQDCDSASRRPVATVGKAWCRADATSRPIRIGNLLTTSSTPGHAMVAADREAAFGSVLGKALTPLVSSTGLVLVLVGLG